MLRFSSCGAKGLVNALILEMASTRIKWLMAHELFNRLDMLVFITTATFQPNGVLIQFSWCQRQTPTNYLNSGANANEVKWVLYPASKSNVPHKWLTALSSSTTGVPLWTAVPPPVEGGLLQPQKSVVHCY